MAGFYLEEKSRSCNGTGGPLRPLQPHLTPPPRAHPAAACHSALIAVPEPTGDGDPSLPLPVLGSLPGCLLWYLSGSSLIPSGDAC